MTSRLTSWLAHSDWFWWGWWGVLLELADIIFSANILRCFTTLHLRVVGFEFEGCPVGTNSSLIPHRCKVVKHGRNVCRKYNISQLYTEPPTIPIKINVCWCVVSVGCARAIGDLADGGIKLRARLRRFTQLPIAGETREPDARWSNVTLKAKRHA